MSHSDVDAIVRDAIESRDAFDPDYDYIAFLDVTRDYFAASMHMIHVFAVVRTRTDELDPADRPSPVETLEIIVRDNEVVSVERISLHHL